MSLKNRWSIIFQARFTFLLISLLLLAILNPLLEEIGLIRAQIVLSISFTVILLSGTYAVSKTRNAFFLVMTLALLSVTLVWLRPFFPGWNVQLAAESLLALYFLLVAVLLLGKVLKDEKVTWEKISAALCVYFLLGIVWAFFYTIASSLRPDSFNMEGSRTFSDFIYYSMITLTTVGYGDIYPVAPITRSLAFVEAITGQLYLAVLVSRLVGLHIVHASGSGENSRSN